MGYIENFKSYDDFSPIEKNIVSLSTSILVDQINVIISKDINLEQDTFPLRMKINSLPKDKNITRIASDVKPVLFAIDGSNFTVDLCDQKNIYKLKNGVSVLNIALI